MTRLKNSKTILISILSLSLLSCAGTPPKLERPIKLYSGTPSRQAMCRKTKAQLTAWVESMAQHSFTRSQVKKIMNAALALDDLECVRADAPAFKAMIGIPADDMRVLLQYQENLLYSCERWRK